MARSQFGFEEPPMLVCLEISGWIIYIVHFVVVLLLP